MSKGLFAKLLGATALAAPVATGAEAPKGASPTNEGEPSTLTEARVETALEAAHSEGAEQGKATGAQEANDRMTAVFASDEGKANMSMAAWMLGANPTASAESIIAHLKTMPAQAAAPAPAKGALTTPLTQTPKADLTGGEPAAELHDGAADADAGGKMWDGLFKAQKEVGPFGASAITSGGTTLNGHAQPRTGY